jgi:Fur family iron response transcriptional regulator
LFVAIGNVTAHHVAQGLVTGMTRAIPPVGFPVRPETAAHNARVLEATLEKKLRGAGLRPTRQRMALGTLLFGCGDRHVTAEDLHMEAVAAGERVSLATVYNTLHQFMHAGLLREVAVAGTKAYFDTNTSNHNHFYIESAGELVDIPSSSIRVDGLPEPPPGMRIEHVDVVVRLVKA